ncbi:unnamed protein product [Rotaria magnacalcarata]|uniref:Uncharacterized protein n=1 Tax=Rotaria magnacalcarata TaxID=392030 RepID=A0A814PXC4_9BILA|nr:unnamed protein product [Rotaria magnacalcarata]CAF1626167.1 unnamed protein product [Rotaria magnacalcarata]CAF2030057.1 unnamed protein product [Rotaria magnacalcarata]CAF2085808.1 unnamed protein product [Rotaria magnacalcarata]CAF2195455.1 unnamed protein product [Rotaria magnacalcarata]
MISISRRVIITLILFTILLLLIIIVCRITLKHNKRKFLLTVVDYRRNPISNVSVRITVPEYHDQESYTNKLGQAMFYLENDLSNMDYLHLTGDDINEKFLLVNEQLTIRLKNINQDTGEPYNEEMFKFN